MTASGPLRKSAVEQFDPRELLLERLESGELELPIIPEAAAAVIEACRDEATGARQVAEIMQRDPALAGHVLRLANSAAYGSSQAIVSLSQAVGRLGLATVSEIALAVALRGRVFSVHRYDIEVRALWVHSAATGVWAREIARLRRRNVEGAFLCGLLHDVGRPVILQGLDDLERATGRRFDEELIAAVSDELHPHVGGVLVRHWSLPEWMAGAIEWHHDPRSAPEHREEAMTTALADQLAHWTLEDQEEEGDDETLRALPILADLNLYPEDLDQLITSRERVSGSALAYA